MSRYNYIAIEGNIGAGKTTLAEHISTQYGARLLLESYADNSFLPSFYLEPQRFAFQVELSFLAERYRHLQTDLANRNLFEPVLVSDYIIQKCLLFAAVNLDKQTFGLYRSIYHAMASRPPFPDILIYLHTPIEHLLTHIARRGRAFEQGITAEYLRRIEREYLKYLRRQRGKRILFINTNASLPMPDSKSINWKKLLELPHPKQLQILEIEDLMKF